MYGNQSRYKELRANVASHMLAEGKKIFACINFAGSGDDAIRKSADAIKLDGSWVGKNAILAAADYFRQEILVFVSSTKISPVIYSPSSDVSVTAPIKVALYEPVHYVFVTDVTVVTSASSTLNFCAPENIANVVR